MIGDVPENILDIERKNATFTVRELTYVLDGGKDGTEVCLFSLRDLFR